MSSSAVADTPPPPVTVVELSGSGAAALRPALAQQGFAVMTSPELDAATSGVDGGQDLGVALAALAQARESFGALDCAAALTAAESAIAALAARGAAGIEVTGSLRAAWSYVLLCKDRAGEVDGAMRAAALLRELLATPSTSPLTGDDAGLAALFAKYPEVDVTANRDVLAVELTAEPGAVFTVDHRPMGTSPVTIYVAAGRHLIAAAAGSRRAARWVDVASDTRALSLPLIEQDARLSRISERVAAWRSSGPDGPGVAAFFEQLLAAAQGQSWNPSSFRSPLLVVLGATSTPSQIQLWASDGPGNPPTMTTIAAPAGSPLGAGSAVTLALIEALRQRHASWRDDLSLPTEPQAQGAALVVKTNGDNRGDERSPSQRPARTQWWVYAAIAGAVAMGGAVILANELAEDTQRVELRWP
ncbi:MAG TPA: hypothetical protein PKU97_08435 [Kofleriaceae bacterium]|nr:hypothetical protein [Kofleriaceae bacterium]